MCWKAKREKRRFGMANREQGISNEEVFNAQRSIFNVQIKKKMRRFSVSQ